MTTEVIQDYFQDILKEFKSGHAREHSYRHAIKKLIENLNPGFEAINEPKRVKAGAPDFVILKGQTPYGYGETKDLNVNLDEVEKSDQVKRYLVLNNLFLTNYLEFRFFLNEEKYETVKIASIENGKLVPNESEFRRLADLFVDFIHKKVPTISNAKRLAKMMADKGRLMQNVIFNVLNDEEQPEGTIHDQYEAIKKVLIHDLSIKAFSDLYAQTITYGLFVARFNDDTPKTFSRREAEELVPKSNPFLRKLFHHISGPDLDDRLVWIVDALADVFLHTDVKEILKDFGKATEQKDPILHFYETFLGEFDPKLKKSKGVYYTPEPVVSFIVRSVDEILKKEFNLKDGLADTTKIEVKREVQGKKVKKNVHKVQILDPAVGTGTFLNEVIKNIHAKFKNQQGNWQNYVDEHLLPRLYGFEILMAPYTMCHLKLGLTLKQTGYKESGERLGVYLTNSLEEPHDKYDTLFSKWLSEESNEASRIKREAPIMIVMENPPYSVSSQNKGDWIQKLIEIYKEGLNEKKINIDDDYIKFIRYAQYYIDKNGEGIVAMITNNSFIDGITHRKMREELMKSFDKIYIYDLHGNAKKKETCPDGGKDENVFDIMQGVSISLFVKTRNSKKYAKVYHSDLFGMRDQKYGQLKSNDVNEIKWKKLKPVEPYYFFVPKQFNTKIDYNLGYKIDKLFEIYSSGIETQKDRVSIKFSRKEIEEVRNDFLNMEDNTIRQKYNLKKDGRDWKLISAINDLKDKNSKITDILYRPFDIRKTIYSGKTKGFLAYPRSEVMRNFIEKENLGLQITSKNRQASLGYFFISKIISDRHLLDTAGDSMQVFPLYIYPDQNQQTLDQSTARHHNLNPEIVKEIAEKLKLTFIDDGKGDGKKTFGPEDILDYIYAVLHSPSYREKYKEFLKIDFPRVPFTSDQKEFWRLVGLGRQLRELHLMKSPKLDKLITTFPKDGDCVVGKVHFEEKNETVGNVWINENQYFGKVPKVAWEFYIGGYQPAQKWLKDRKGRKLSSDEIMHYQKIIVALVETGKLMEKIDK
jgi:predicted helicase